MRPLSIHGCLGWLHPARSRRGVVLCGALDYEGLCTYRPLYDLAGRLAAAGCPVLRFDWPGRGDSAAEAVGAGFAADCIAAARAAVDRLKAETGATGVVLAGLRYGALVAALAAEGRGDIEGLALLAPPASGKAFVRELGIQARMLAAAGAVEPPSGLSVAGFDLLEPALTGIRGLDPAAGAVPGVRRMLVLQPEGRGGGLPEAPASAAGGAVEVERFAGYESLMQNPTQARVPPAWERVVGWVQEGAEDLANEAAAAPAAAMAPTIGDGFAEEVVAFGPDGGLLGILCRPRGGEASATVVIPNAGRNPRSGWGRGTVDMARTLAREGIASFRFDGAGIGDSMAAPPGVEPLYSPGALGEMRLAVDALAARGLGGFILCGLCAGAYLAFHGAVRDARVAGLVAVNLQRFIWREGDSLAVAMAQAPRPKGYYGRRMLRRDTWLRLVRGGIDLRSILGSAARRLVRQPLGRVAAALGALAGRDTPVGRVRGWVRALEARGVRATFVYAQGDPGLGEVSHHFGRDGAWLTQRSGVERVLIPDSDHDLTPRAARETLARIVIGVAKAVR